MPYALRTPEGTIASLHRDPVAGAEAVHSDQPEVLAFLGKAGHEQHFASLDAHLVRVLEDLIDALIERNVLRITDLPAEAQQKLFARKSYRDRVKGNALQLFGDGLAPVPGSRDTTHTDFDTL